MNSPVSVKLLNELNNFVRFISFLQRLWQKPRQLLFSPPMPTLAIMRNRQDSWHTSFESYMLLTRRQYHLYQSETGPWTQLLRLWTAVLRPQVGLRSLFRGFPHHTSPSSEGLEVFYVSATQHIIRRQGSLKSTQLSPSEPMNTSSSAHLPLPLPNPFKALASRSTEHVIEELLAEKKDSPDLVLHGENTDLGTLALGDRISGLRISSCQGGVRGVVWTQSELAVSLRSSLFKNL